MKRKCAAVCLVCCLLLLTCAAVLALWPWDRELRARYDRIAIGMPYREVVQIMGEEGSDPKVETELHEGSRGFYNGCYPLYWHGQSNSAEILISANGDDVEAKYWVKNRSPWKTLVRRWSPGLANLLP